VQAKIRAYGYLDDLYQVGLLVGSAGITLSPSMMAFREKLLRQELPSAKEAEEYFLSQVWSDDFEHSFMFSLFEELFQSRCKKESPAERT
jgi:hypothetical protein